MTNRNKFSLDFERSKLAILIALLAIISISLVAFSFGGLVSVIISSSGNVQTGTGNTAKSGSAKDIQSAVNWVVANLNGKGNVYVPAGTWNWTNPGQSWVTVTVPAGVNIFGATTTRDSNDQVTSWNTIIRMSHDEGGNIDTGEQWTFFVFQGSNDPAKPSEMRDIKVVGYRSFDHSSVTMQCALRIDSVADFRIDHCCFEDTPSGIAVTDAMGVIDHCRIYNLYGWDDLGGYSDSTIGYGVGVYGDYHTPFAPTMNMLGHYANYITYIENCYFSWWRHCVAEGVGGYYVFRYNTIEYDMGHFSLDVHGVRTQGYAGGRGAEIYSNTFLHVNQYIPLSVDGHSQSQWGAVSYNSTPSSSPDYRCLFQDGGGCGVWFNNYVDTSYRSDGIALYTEDDVADATWHLKDFYLWSTKGPWSPPSWNGPISGFSGRNVAAYWSRQAGNLGDTNYPNVDPSWSIAGYTPYTYPHPLTLTP